MANIKLAFLGAGKMAGALLSGVLKEGIFNPLEIGCLCGGDGTGAALARRTGIRYIPDVNKLLLKSQVVILACKPQQISELPPEVQSLTEDSLILSILAGVKLKRLRKTFPKARNIVRAMPNTPGQIGAGITAFTPLSEMSDHDLLSIESILSALGVFMELPEEQLDAVTAVSGSGPAYVFEFTIALREAAEAAGLPRKVAEVLARETVFGAAKLMESTWSTPEDLRDSVTSKGGTTQAALEAIGREKENLHGLIKKAVLAAKKRSIELSEEF